MSVESTVDRPIQARQTGAHALLGVLERWGVRHLFGVPGHGAYPIYDALNDFPEMHAVVGRNEQGSTFAATGYAWARGGMAVATAVPEAGLTNASTALLEATLSQDRLLFVLEFDPIHGDIIRAVARHHVIVDETDEIARATEQLVDALHSGRPGAAVLEITNAALSATLDSGIETYARSTSSAPLLEDAVSFLEHSDHVVICAGASACSAEAGAEIRELAERLRAPVLLDGFARGLLPDGHPLSLGRSWTPGGPCKELIGGADAIVMIGAPVAAPQNRTQWEPSFVTTARTDAELERSLVIVDWDDLHTGSLPARSRLYGNVRAIVGELAERLAVKDSRGYADDELRSVRSVPSAYAEQTIPHALTAFAALERELPDDAIILTDSLIGIWLDRLYPAQQSRAMRFPWGTGTLGWGIPAAVGAKLAFPYREVVSVAGDGATLFNPQELATAQRHNLKLIFVVANDNCYSAIRYNMLEDFGRSGAHELINPDFVALAESFGIRGVRLPSTDAFGAALAAAVKSPRSTLIDLPLELRPPRGLYSWVL